MMIGFSGIDDPMVIDRTQQDCRPIGENEVFEREDLKRVTPNDWREKEPFYIVPIFNDRGHLDFGRSEIYRECEDGWKKVSGFTRGKKLREYDKHEKKKEAA